MVPITGAENQRIAPMRNTSYPYSVLSGGRLSVEVSNPMGNEMWKIEHWPEMSTMHINFGEFNLTDSDDLESRHIEKAMEQVREEAEEERRLDPELGPIPETAYRDVGRFLKRIIRPDYSGLEKVVPLPDIMPLDNGEIGLEWREGQRIVTLSFGGDGHIVFAGIFGAESQARGILTFSTCHLNAVVGMITSLYPYYND